MLDYMHARYYSAGAGRFLSVDPVIASNATEIPQAWNRYAYVLNTPTNLVDPTGLMSQCLPEFFKDEKGNHGVRLRCSEGEAATVTAKAPRNNLGDSGKFRYASRDQAALAAAQTICATSVRVDREYGGAIYQSNAGFAFSPPQRGGRHSMRDILGTNNVWGSVAFMRLLPPPGIRLVGTYHTHGAMSEGYLDEAISTGDLETAYKSRLATYVATPSGRVLKYDPLQPTLRAPKAFDFQLGVVPCR